MDALCQRIPSYWQTLLWGKTFHKVPPYTVSGNKWTGYIDRPIINGLHVSAMINSNLLKYVADYNPVISQQKLSLCSNFTVCPTKQTIQCIHYRAYHCRDWRLTGMCHVHTASCNLTLFICWIPGRFGIVLISELDTMYHCGLPTNKSLFLHAIRTLFTKYGVQMKLASWVS